MNLHDMYMIGNLIRIGIMAYDATMDQVSIAVNRVVWTFKYYILNDKSRNFIIDERKTNHVIYCKGHLITHTTYKIFMLDDSDFEMKKGFITTNVGNVDLSNPQDESSCQNNRFNSHIIKVDKIQKHSEGNLKVTFTEASKEQKEKIKLMFPLIDYKKDATFFIIKQDGQKRFSSFSFSLYISIPDEFKERKNLNDEINLNHKCYGVFEYSLKIDKDSEQVKKFSPKLRMNNKYKIPKHLMDSFYIGRHWRIRPALQRSQSTKISVIHE